jgi:hypothetical protein
MDPRTGPELKMSDPYEADLGDDLDDVDDETEDELDEPDEAEIDEPDEADDPDEEDEPPARQPTRGENRVAKATREAAEAKREAKELKERLAALEQRSTQPSAESQRQREARLAEMEPLERQVFLMQEDRAAEKFQTQDRLDRMAFDATCRAEPAVAKIKDKVESELAALRGRGQNVDREVLADWLLGKQARANAGRASTKTTKAAAARRQQQQARPGAPRGDAAPADRRDNSSKAARDKRLADYQL